MLNEMDERKARALFGATRRLHPCWMRAGSDHRRIPTLKILKTPGNSARAVHLPIAGERRIRRLELLLAATIGFIG
jgi:hypothetical protein